MAITINWLTKVINIPKADTTLIQLLPQEVRELNIDDFRLELKEIESSDQGMPFLDTHAHNTEVPISNVIIARVVEIINGYTILFEDGAYAVNLIGANSNISDVTLVNQVSLRSANSAGLTAPGFGPNDKTKIDEVWKLHGLDTAAPLEVSTTERSAGTEITQTIATGVPPVPGDDPPVTVTRNP